MNSHCVPAGSPWATSQMTVPGLDSAVTVFQDAAGGAGNRRGRVIFFPSSGQYAGQINDTTSYSAGLQGFQTTMSQDGWQVLSVDEAGVRGSSVVTDVPTDPAGNGSRAFQTTLHYLDHILMWAAQNHGGHMPTIIAGFSYGGWATLAGAMNRTSVLAAFIARSPVIQWNAYPTDTGFVYPTFAGANTSAMNLTTNASVTITSAPTTNGTNATLTTTGSFSAAGITSGTVISVSMQVVGLAQGTYANLIGSYVVNSGATSTSISIPYTSSVAQPTTTVVSGTLNQTGSTVTVASGGANTFYIPTTGGPTSGTFQVTHSSTNYTVTYTGVGAGGNSFTGCTIASGSVTLSSGDVITGIWQGGLVVSTNTYLNNSTIPGLVGNGNNNELIAWEQVTTMAATAANAGAPISHYFVNGEEHVWDPQFTAYVCASTYSGSTTYVTNQVVYYSGNVYTCIQTSTGNLPTNTSYFTLIGAQSAQGWVQTTLDGLYPKKY